MLLGKGKGFAAVRGVGDDGELGDGFEQETQALADYGVVVGEDDADRGHATSLVDWGWSGSSAR